MSEVGQPANCLRRKNELVGGVKALSLRFRKDYATALSMVGSLCISANPLERKIVPKGGIKQKTKPEVKPSPSRGIIEQKISRRKTQLHDSTFSTQRGRASTHLIG